MFGGVKDLPVYVESVRTVPAWKKWSSVTPGDYGDSRVVEGALPPLVRLKIVK
jgi:hypothetical protein